MVQLVYQVACQHRTSCARVVALILVGLLLSACRGPASPPAEPAPPARQALAEMPAAATEVGHAGDLAPYYDRTNPGFDKLQRPAQAMADFPRTRLGEVDWVTALRSGRIDPRKGLDEDATLESREKAVIMTATRQMPHVRFPHDVHTDWLGCDNCHDQLFERTVGAHTATMNDIFAGKSCGTCHDQVAFSTYACERCHSVPLEAK